MTPPIIQIYRKIASDKQNSTNHCECFYLERQDFVENSDEKSLETGKKYCISPQLYI